jgi:surface antigen Omp85-like protein
VTSTAPYRSRSDPLVLFAFALLLGLPAAALGQDASTTSTPTFTAVRVATQAILSEEPVQDVPPAAEPKTTGAPEGFFRAPRLITRAINYATRTIGDGSRSSNGFYPEFSNMITGAGWISAGPGYRHWFMNDRAIVETSAGVSWRMYKMAQARVEFTNLAHSRLAVGSQVLWQDATQITYFGVGADTLEDSRSEYRMKTADVTGYTTVRPTKWLSIIGRAGWLQRPTLLSPAGTFKRGNPDTQSIFPGDAVFSLTEQPSYIHGDASIVADTRDSRSHPYSGGVYRAGVTAYSDRGEGMFSFRRYEAEAAHFVPLASDRVVLALHGWLVGSETAANEVVPFYLMPALGGGNTLRGYTDFRFHDRNLLLVNAESRFALLKHVDLAAFVDAGNVAPTVSELNLDKTCYGFGLRLHSGRATFTRVDVAHGAEGWRLLLRTSDPLHLSRLSRRTAAAPFVP